MTIWRAEQGRQRATALTLEVLRDIERDLPTYQHPRPSVRSIRIGAELNDRYDFEVEIELIPGAVVAVKYQSVDEEGRNPDKLESQSGNVSGTVNDTVKEFFRLSTGIEALADRLHDLRVQTRKALAAWSDRGIGASLVDIRFECTEYWVPGRELIIEGRLRSLDNRLRPTIVSLIAEHPDEFMAHLAASRPHIERLFATRTLLSRLGADGVVDRLVLNAIELHDEPATAWRTIASGGYYWGSQELTVWTSDGLVRCHGHSADGRVSWNMRSVTLDVHPLSEAEAAALPGQPITRLLKHPVLSDDMIISAETEPSTLVGCRALCLELEQPPLLFCSASGRVWSADGIAASELTALVHGS